MLLRLVFVVCVFFSSAFTGAFYLWRCLEFVSHTTLSDSLVKSTTSRVGGRLEHQVLIYYRYGTWYTVHGTWYHKLDARGAKPALHAISMLMLEV